MATSSFNFERMFLNLVFFVLQIGNGFHSLLFDDFAFAWNFWFPLVRYLLPGNILQGKRFLVHLWNGEVNFNNFVQGTWIWCQRLIPLCSSTSEFLLLGAVRLHQPDQVKHYLFGGVRSFITITGDSGFLFTLLRTRFWACNFLFRILSSVLHLIYVNAGNFFWRDFLSTAF